MARNWYDLVESAKEDLRNEYEGPDERDYHDVITEIADQSVPVYNHDLLELAMSNLWLATHDSDLGPVENAIQALQYAVYEQVSQELHGFLAELDQEWEDEHAECCVCLEKYVISDSTAQDSDYYCSVECQTEDEKEVEAA